MKNSAHSKKLVAPVVIAALLILYYLGFAAVCVLVDGVPLLAKLLFGIIPLLLMGVVIYVLVERIKEIRSGEEDDLGQY